MALPERSVKGGMAAVHLHGVQLACGVLRLEENGTSGQVLIVDVDVSCDAV